MQGLVFKRTVESNIIKKANAKIAAYTCPIDITQSETKVSLDRRDLFAVAISVCRIGLVSYDFYFILGNRFD